MAVIAFIVNAVADLYFWIILISVLLSWLLTFNVINRHNQIVDMIWRTCLALTEPVLRPIRKALPSLGGLDISPVVLLIGIRAAQIGLNKYVFIPMIDKGL
jgi:YggT family protein